MEQKSMTEEQEYHGPNQQFIPVRMHYISSKITGEEVPDSLLVEHQPHFVGQQQQYVVQGEQPQYYRQTIHYSTSDHPSSQQWQQQWQNAPISQQGKQFGHQIDFHHHHHSPHQQQFEQKPKMIYPDPHNKSATLDEIQALESGEAVDPNLPTHQDMIEHFNRINMSRAPPPQQQSKHYRIYGQQLNRTPSPPLRHQLLPPDHQHQHYQYYAHDDNNYYYGGGGDQFQQDDEARAPYNNNSTQYEYAMSGHPPMDYYQRVSCVGAPLHSSWQQQATAKGQVGSAYGAVLPANQPPPVFTSGPELAQTVTYRDAAQRRRAESEGGGQHSHDEEAQYMMDQGYLFGGMDFIDHRSQPAPGDPRNYVTLTLDGHRWRREMSEPQRRPGDYYGLDYTTLIGEGQVWPPEEDTNYKGYVAQKPKKHWHFTADPLATTLNNFEVEVMESVDPVRLVGDTLSNQKINTDRELTEEEKTQFCTTYTAPEGFKPEHKTVHPEPKSPEPICYSLSVKKELATADGHSSTPASQGQSCLPAGGRPAPRNSADNQSWYTGGNKEIMRSEPNWTRTVDQRRNAWEHNARRTESRLYLPSWAKVPPPQPPPWANLANTTHNKWQTAADRGYIASGNYNTGYNYSITNRAQPKNNANIGTNLQVEDENNSQVVYYTQPDQQQDEEPQQQEEQKPIEINQQQNIAKPQSAPPQPPQKPEMQSTQPADVSGQQIQQTHQSQYSQQKVPQQQHWQANIQSQSQQVPQYSQQNHRFPPQPQQKDSLEATQQLRPHQKEPVQQPKVVTNQQQWQQQTNRQQQLPLEHQQQQQYQRRPEAQQYLPNNKHYSQQQQQSYTTTIHTTTYNGENEVQQEEGYRQEARVPQQPQAFQQQNQQIAPKTVHQHQQKPQQHYFRKQLSQPLANTRPGSIKPVGQTAAADQPQQQQLAHHQQQQRVNSQRVEEKDHHGDRAMQYAQHYPATDQHYQYHIVHQGPPHQQQQQHHFVPQQQQRVQHHQQFYSPQFQRRNFQQPGPPTTIQRTFVPQRPQPTNDQNFAQRQQEQQQYQREIEEEQFPVGEQWHTYANTSGQFQDKDGSKIEYRREITTTSNPSHEMQLVKQHENKVTEEPNSNEPGMITRHVTTKFYKKKTISESLPPTRPTL